MICFPWDSCCGRFLKNSTISRGVPWRYRVYFWQEGAAPLWYCELVGSCLDVNADKRPSAQAVLDGVEMDHSVKAAVLFILAAN